jgi:hypothetical protein
MGLSQIISGVTVMLTGLLPMSCHKAAQQTKTAPASTVAGATNSVSTLRNLGEVALTNHFETCLQLGEGKDCTFSPKMLDSHTVQITVSLETKNNAGKTHDLEVTQVVTRDGKPFEVAVGDLQLSLTPKVNSD